MKQLAKQAIAQMPGPVGLFVIDVIGWIKNRRRRTFLRRQDRVYRSLGCPRVIAGGPFKGMAYIARANGSCLLPKLMGTYEMELVPAIQTIHQSECDLLVDIGSAEGYYAVGFAMSMPKTRIVCYEIYKPARYLLSQLARLNGVAERIEQKARCTPAELQGLLVGARMPVVICDCEGAEDFLLLPDQTPELRRSMILVELHDALCAGVTERIRQRFSESHSIEVFSTCDRTSDMLPPGCRLPNEEGAIAMDEDRGGVMQWFFMVPKA